MEKQFIRNFCIIAHIDHGKSTLADRILEFTGAVNKREFKEQFLDDMDLERERGITIKASCVTLKYKSQDQNTYTLNLIDTPGHVDFSYEVTKSLKACEGAILLVDASQGIEAQTIANFYLALENNLEIIPVINKIDLPNADIERTKHQLTEILGFKESEIILASAKEGRGTKEILEAVVKKIPPPQGEVSQPLRALIFDSTYDTFKGVILFIRVKEGMIKKGMKIMFMRKGREYEVQELGILTPKFLEKESLSVGEVGYLCCNIKDPSQITVGDTITSFKDPAPKALEGYQQMQPVVFCGIFPQNPKDFFHLREAIQKLRLSDPSFVYEPDNSVTWGPGFRCGFLGLLHMEIIQERLEREFGLNLILTTPNVVYLVKDKKGNEIKVENPLKFPDPSQIAQVLEPFIKVKILTPLEYLERVMELSKQKRGVFKKMDYLGKDRISVEFEMPLNEVIVDFYDKLKSVTKGYGSLDYEFIGYRPSEIVKLDILINNKPCEAFSFLVHKSSAYQKAKNIVEKLKKLIPRQQFVINIQAAIGSRIIASEKIPALRKNVTAKCYGGDITRKMKLWEKQKEGKKKLKQFGKVQIPQEAFLEILKI